MTVPTTPVGAYKDNTSADTTLSNIPLLKKDGAFDGRLTGDTATTVGPDGYDNFVIDIAGGTHDSSASLTSSDTLTISYTLDSAGSIDIEEEPILYSNLDNGFGPDSNLRTHIVSGTGTLTIPASHWSTVVPGDYAFYIMISASTPNGGIGYRGTYHLTLSIGETPNPDPGPPPPTTTSTWNSTRAPTGGDFNDPSNWTPISVPGPTNDVFFNLPGGSSGGVFSNTNAHVRSLSFGNGGLGYAPGYDLLINAGTFTVDYGLSNYGTIIIAVPAHLVVGAAATLNAPVQNNGGLIDFDGPVSVQGGANSNNAFVTNNGGTTNFAGPFTISEFGHLAVNSGVVNLNGANNTLVNSVPVGYGATLAINGATTLGFSGSVQLSGLLSVNAGGSVFVNGGLSVINNSGVSVTGGFLQVGGTNSFDVGLSGGELQLMQPGSFHGRILFNGSAAGSVIDLASTPVTSVRITPTNPAPGQSGAVLSMTSGTTGQVLAYQLISPGFTYFTAQPDGSGGTYLIATPGVPTDLVMRNSGTGALEIYDIGNNALLGAASMGAVGLDWKTAGFGGFSGHAGEGDMLMRNTKTGALYVYDIANNALTAAYAMGAVGLDWAVGGFGDFSGRPNETDMIMRNTKTGALEVYDIAHNALTSAFSMGAVGLDWQFAGFGNFSGRPNETDMIMRNSKTGALYVYDIVNNALTSAYSMGAVGLDWQVAGFGNFSGRANETDMIMRNTKTGALYVYDIANNALTSAFSMGTIGLDWSVAGFGSFGANPNESDMLMRNGSTGALEVYDIYGNTIISAASVGAVGLNWQVGGIAAASPVGSTAAANGQAGATAQLVQAIAGFGGSSGAADALITSPLGEEISQQPLLSASQHA
jgi:hypothetical protein